MSEIKKPQRKEPVLEAVEQVEEEVKIVIGDKQYELPDLKFGEYKAFVKKIEERDLDAILKMTESEMLEATADMYFELLSPHYPELKREDFDEMPLYMAGADFYNKVKAALFRIPLP